MSVSRSPRHNETLRPQEERREERVDAQRTAALIGVPIALIAFFFVIWLTWVMRQ